MGRLLMKKRKFTEDVARIYASEILLALEHLHKNAIVFRLNIFNNNFEI